MIITVVGECCEDIFIYGDSKRLSPEAPVPVFVPHLTKTNLGMAGNVSENLKSLSPESIIQLVCQPENIKKTRLIDEKSNHMFIRVDEGEENITKIEITQELIDKITISDIVIVSDYNKGFMESNDMVEIAKNSKLSILDSKKKLTEDVVKNFDFIKLNEIEYQNNVRIVNENSHKFLITLGMNGCQYMGKKYPSPSPIQTMDVSGAGDTFTASFIIKYCETKNVDESLIFANKMASIVVTKRGVATP
jgi:D-beta-D-heptose 7-phosphate kinase/D-beta-D-heptose 1-phosphate adenosyltransferase